MNIRANFDEIINTIKQAEAEQKRSAHTAIDRWDWDELQRSLNEAKNNMSILSAWSKQLSSLRDAICDSPLFGGTLIAETSSDITVPDEVPAFPIEEPEPIEETPEEEPEPEEEAPEEEPEPVEEAPEKEPEPEEEAPEEEPEPVEETPEEEPEPVEETPEEETEPEEEAPEEEPEPVEETPEEEPEPIEETLEEEPEPVEETPEEEPEPIEEAPEEEPEPEEEAPEEEPEPIEETPEEEPGPVEETSEEEPEPEPVKESAPASSGGMMSQDAIEALLAANAAASEPEPEPVKESAPASSGGMMSQDAIEALLAANAAEPEPEPVEEKPAPASSGGMMSQDAIEALLAANAAGSSAAASEPFTAADHPAEAEVTEIDYNGETYHVSDLNMAMVQICELFFKEYRMKFMLMFVKPVAQTNNRITREQLLLSDEDGLYYDGTACPHIKMEGADIYIRADMLNSEKWDFITELLEYFGVPNDSMTFK